MENNEYKPFWGTRYVFRISKYVYHTYEEIGHSKCLFSHPGTWTGIPYLHILEYQRILHPEYIQIYSDYIMIRKYFLAT